VDDRVQLQDTDKKLEVHDPELCMV
jgi:hypothetical protein